MLSKILKQKNRSTFASSVVSEIDEALAGKELVRPEHTQAALSMESVSDIASDEITSVLDEVDTIVSYISTSLEQEGRGSLTKAQVEAAKIGVLLAGDPRTSLSLEQAVQKSSSSTIVVPQSSEEVIKYDISMEAYDERENKQVINNSFKFNLLGSRQDDFAETLFPTITVSPDQSGLAVDLDAITLYTNFSRTVDGSIDKPKYNNKRIMDSFLDHTVLDRGSLALVPEFDSTIPAHANVFFDGANTQYSVDVDGTTIITAPLAVGNKVSLLGISQNDSLITQGVLDVTDSLDPHIRVKELWFDADAGNGAADYFKITVSHLASSNFVHSLQDHHRDAILSMTNQSVVIEANNFNNIAGSPIATGGALPAGYTAIMSLTLNGTSNLEDSDTVVYVNEFKLHKLFDNNGVEVTSGGAFTAAESFLNNIKPKGYVLEAYRTNSNRRTRGQLVKVDNMRYIYNVIPSNPISVIKPVNDLRDDNSDLTTLIAINAIRMSNDAVTALVNWSAELASNVNAMTNLGLDPQLHTVSTYLVKPYYASEAIDLATIVDSRTSSDRSDDIRSALLLKVRDHVYRMVTSTAYSEALNVMYASNPPRPTVVIATDGRLAGWLQAADTQSIFGVDFDVKIVSKLDKRLTGRMFISFTIYDNERNTRANPLSFGATGYKPTVPVVLPMSRNNTISKELTVSSCYRHIPLLPMMVEFTVTNIDSVIGKVAVHNKAV